MRADSVRPDLSAGLWNNGESHSIVVQSYPSDLSQRRQGSCELCWCVSVGIVRLVVWSSGIEEGLNILLNVLMFLTEVLKRMVTGKLAWWAWATRRVLWA